MFQAHGVSPHGDVGADSTFPLLQGPSSASRLWGQAVARRAGKPRIPSALSCSWQGSAPTASGCSGLGFNLGKSSLEEVPEGTQWWLEGRTCLNLEEQGAGHRQGEQRELWDQTWLWHGTCWACPPRVVPSCSPEADSGKGPAALGHCLHYSSPTRAQVASWQWGSLAFLKGSSHSICVKRQCCIQEGSSINSYPTGAALSTAGVCSSELACKEVLLPFPEWRLGSDGASDTLPESHS